MRYFIAITIALALSMQPVFAQETPMSSDAPVEVIAEKVLSQDGSTRATAYMMSNKILTLGSQTHVAWLDDPSDIMTRTYFHQRKRWGPPVHVGSGEDNHSGPAMCSDSEGYIHMIFGPHHDPFQYVVSARPNDASEWVRQPSFGVTATYPSLVCGPDDTLHVTYRGLSRPPQLAYQKKPKGGEWTEPRALVDAGTEDGYTQFGNGLYVEPDGTLHLDFHVYDIHSERGHSAGYLRSEDAGETWTLADGTPVDLPMTPSDDGWVEQGDDLNMRVTNITCDSDGHPYFVTIHYDERPYGGTLWRYINAQWHATDIGTVVREEFPGQNVVPGTICFDDEGMLYIAVQVSEVGAWGKPDCEIAALTSSDGGESFSVRQLSDDAGDVGNWMPSLERFTGHNTVTDPGLIYIHGIRGDSTTTEAHNEIRYLQIATSEQ